MQRSPQPRRTPSTLSASAQKHLNSYALAAGAAGVSLLALAQSSEAGVVYTPADQTIGRNGSYKLDLNHDGIVDYIISEQAGKIGSFESYQQLYALGAVGNHVICSTSFCISTFIYAAALRLGSRIGSHVRGHGWLYGHNGPMAYEALSQRGSVYYGWAWVNVSDRYLGLRFQINGETHFGWARLTVKFQRGLPKDRSWEAHLTGYAYETVAGKAIRAGQTSDKTVDATESTHPDPLVPNAFVRRPVSRPAQFAALGTLALGSDGVSLWRREDSESDDGKSNWLR